MSSKTLIWIGVFVGSTVGGAIPLLWGDTAFSIASIIFSTLGGLAGIWTGFKISHIL